MSIWTKPEYEAADKARNAALMQDANDQMGALSAAVDAALAIKEREIAKLREANKRLRDGYADAVAGYNYILAHHGRLSGVGFDRVMDHFAEWVTIPEREGLLAGSHYLPQ